MSPDTLLHAAMVRAKAAEQAFAGSGDLPISSMGRTVAALLTLVALAAMVIAALL